MVRVYFKRGSLIVENLFLLGFVMSELVIDVSLAVKVNV